MGLQEKLATPFSFVELEGVEPSSKRGTNKLSTCLVVDLVFDYRQAQDHQPAA